MNDTQERSLHIVPTAAYITQIWLLTRCHWQEADIQQQMNRAAPSQLNAPGCGVCPVSSPEGETLEMTQGRTECWLGQLCCTVLWLTGWVTDALGLEGCRPTVWPRLTMKPNRVKQKARRAGIGSGASEQPASACCINTQAQIPLCVQVHVSP